MQTVVAAIEYVVLNCDMGSALELVDVHPTMFVTPFVVVLVHPTLPYTSQSPAVRETEVIVDTLPLVTDTAEAKAMLADTTSPT